jgi:hypothetical protein
MKKDTGGVSTHNTVELGTLVAAGLALGVLVLARGELTEILGSLGDDVVEELKLDATEGLACERERC